MVILKQKSIIIIMGSGARALCMRSLIISMTTGEKTGYLHVHLIPAIFCKAFY